VAGAFLLRWFVSGLSEPAIRGGIDAVLTKYRAYEDDPRAYIFWLTSSMLAVRLIVNTLTGVLAAMAAKGREMTATIALGLLGDVLAIQATLWAAARTGDRGVLWTVPHTFAFSLAIVAAGGIVRMCRLHAATRRPVE
jgi:hypothetical protein